MGVEIAAFTDRCLQGFATVVDCLLGTGFKGGLRDNYRQAIEAVNGANAFTVSVDINSGLDGDTGECELAVRSDLTVTVGFLKHGLLTENAGRYIKRLVCADIGIRLAREERTVTAETAPPWVDLTPITVEEA